MKHVAVDGHDEEIPADPDVQAGLACLSIGLRLAYESDRSLFDGMSASPNSLANRHSDALGTLGDIGVMRDMCPSGNRSREIPGLTRAPRLLSTARMSRAAQIGSVGNTPNSLVRRHFR